MRAGGRYNASEEHGNEDCMWTELRDQCCWPASTNVHCTTLRSMMSPSPTMPPCNFSTALAARLACARLGSIVATKASVLQSSTIINHTRKGLPKPIERRTSMTMCPSSVLACALSFVHCLLGYTPRRRACHDREGAKGSVCGGRHLGKHD